MVLGAAFLGLDNDQLALPVCFGFEKHRHRSAFRHSPPHPRQGTRVVAVTQIDPLKIANSLWQQSRERYPVELPCRNCRRTEWVGVRAVLLKRVTEVQDPVLLLQTPDQVDNASSETQETVYVSAPLALHREPEPFRWANWLGFYAVSNPSRRVLLRPTLILRPCPHHLKLFFWSRNVRLMSSTADSRAEARLFSP